MDIKGVLAISGKPGLYKMISQTKGGLIVEGFDDKKRIPVYSAHQISALEEISIYTAEGDVSLKDVFKKMFELLEGSEAMSAKTDKNTMMKFFGQVLPNYDDEKVYHSDVKKLFQWYNALHKHGYLVFDEAEVEEIKEEVTEEKSE